MKLYIFPYVGGITNGWHDGGGVVVITNGDPVEAYNATEDIPAPLTSADFGEPSSVIEVAPGTAPAVHIFPDAGCC